MSVSELDSIHSKPSTQNKKYNLLENLANIAIIISVICAGFQLWKYTSYEKTRITYDVISKTNSSQFLRAYTNLKTNHKKRVGNDDRISDKLVDDFNLVMNVFDTVYIFYDKDILDKELVATYLKGSAEEMYSICDSFSKKTETPQSFKNTIQNFLKMLANNQRS